MRTRFENPAMRLALMGGLLLFAQPLVAQFNAPSVGPLAEGAARLVIREGAVSIERASSLWALNVVLSEFESQKEGFVYFNAIDCASNTCNIV